MPPVFLRLVLQNIFNLEFDLIVFVFLIYSTLHEKAIEIVIFAVFYINYNHKLDKITKEIRAASLDIYAEHIRRRFENIIYATFEQIENCFL